MAWRDGALRSGRFVRGRLVEGTFERPASPGWLTWRVDGNAVLQRRGYQVRASLCGDTPCHAAELVIGSQSFEVEMRERITHVLRGPRNGTPERGVAAALATAIADVDMVRDGDLHVVTLVTRPPLTMVIDRLAGEVEIVGMGAPMITIAPARQLAHGWSPTTFSVEIAGPGPARDRQLQVRDSLVMAEPASMPRRAWREVVPSRLARVRTNLHEAATAAQTKDLERIGIALRDAVAAAEQARDAATSAPHALRTQLAALAHAVDELRDRGDATVRVTDIASRAARASTLARWLVHELALELARVATMLEGIDA